MVGILTEGIESVHSSYKHNVKLNKILLIRQLCTIKCMNNLQVIEVLVT